MPAVSSSTKSLRKALRQNAHSRCLDIGKSKAAFYLESETVVRSWEISPSGPRFPHLSDEAIMSWRQLQGFWETRPVKPRVQCYTLSKELFYSYWRCCYLAMPHLLRDLGKWLGLSNMVSSLPVKRRPLPSSGDEMGNLPRHFFWP